MLYQHWANCDSVVPTVKIVDCSFTLQNVSVMFYLINTYCYYLPLGKVYFQ